MRVVNLLLSTFLAFGLTILTQGQTYDLELLNVSIPNTVVMGQMVPVSGDIKNNGPDAFIADSGFITMNVHASYTPVPDPYVVEEESSFKVLISRIDADSTIPFSGEFLADINNFRAGQSGISVIVWPRVGGGGGTDTDQENHYYITTVRSVDSANVLNSIDPQALLASQIGLYPNPANGYVQLDLPEKMTGTLSLLTLSGQTLKQFEISPYQQSYRINLKDVKGSTGIYLLTFSGKGNSWTKKLMIQRD